MQVLVTGATGYVGERVVRRLSAHGHDVLGLSRSEAGAARLRALGARALVGDLSEAERLADAARSSDPTLHLGFGHDGDFADAVRVDHALHAALVEALAGTAKTLIVSNGTGGLGNTGDRIADEATAVDLDFPLAVRNKAENLATAAASRGVRAMAIRLPLLVYGHGGSVFLPMLVASARERGVSAYIGDGANHMSAVHVDDAADLYVRALDHGRAGEVYFAAAGDDVSFADVAGAVATGLGCATESVTPERAAEIWNPVWAFLLSLTNRVSGQKARRELGWAPLSSPGLLKDVAHGSYARHEGVAA